MEIMVNDANFETDVLKSSCPVLVDFYADWCGPCKMMAPAIKELAEEFAGRVTVAKCDVDASMTTAYTYQIQAIPTLIIFKNGQPVYKTVGFTDKETVKAAMEAAL